MCSFPKINDLLTTNSDELIANLYNTHSGTESMFESGMNILGVKDIHLKSPKNLLTHVGMDFEKQYLIKKKLQSDFGIELIDRDLEMMTIGKFHDLSREVQQFQNHLIKNEKIVKNKLFNFKLFIGLTDDRIRLEYPNTLMYELHSESSSYHSKCCAILLPGLDNDVSYFADIAYDICFTNFIVKYGNQDMHVKVIADEILKDISKFCYDKQSFKLIGYSFGSLVAIELARALEELNKSVKIIFIDGSPLLLKLATHNFVCDIDRDNSFSLEVATSIAHLITPSKLPGIFRQQLRFFKSWDGKVRWLTDLTRIHNLTKTEKSFNFDENFDNICKGLFNRMYAAAEYEFDQKQPVNSPITLIKPSEETISQISDDYGLSLCTSGLVEVKIFQGNHYTILENSKIIDVINEFDF